jgi:hypothetical protein
LREPGDLTNPRNTPHSETCQQHCELLVPCQLTFMALKLRLVTTTSLQTTRFTLSMIGKCIL